MRLANQHYYIIGGFYCKLKRLLSTCIAGGFFKDCLTKNSDTVRGVITYLQYRCFPVDSIYNNRSHNYHSLCETRQNMFLYTTMLYRVFDLLRFSGVDGSRTRVQKPIPCPSTIIVCLFAAGLAPAPFPPESGSRHPDPFGSFMIRLQGQSLTCIVSHIVDARVLKCECSKSDSCH